MHNTSRINLTKSAVKSNFDFIKALLKPGVKLSAVVKGNAYGHGIEEYIPLAESCGFEHFSVFSANEAYRVKNASKKNSPILIMGDIHPEDLEWVIENEVDFFVFEIARVEQAAKIAKKAFAEERAVMDVAREMTDLSDEELKNALDPMKMTKGGFMD